MPDPLLDPDGIDHVELTVPDRYDAATWYHDTLGFDIVDHLEDWAENPNNPLMISPDDGDTMLALFEGTPTAPGDGSYSRVAIRTAGAEFISFLDHADDIPDIEISGPDHVVDHDRSYSLYFTDPYGHPLEVTTYDYEFVTDHLTPTA